MLHESDAFTPEKKRGEVIPRPQKLTFRKSQEGWPLANYSGLCTYDHQALVWGSNSRAQVGRLPKIWSKI